jgi:hypothetical protein
MWSRFPETGAKDNFTETRGMSIIPLFLLPACFWNAGI